MGPFKVFFSNGVAQFSSWPEALKLATKKRCRIEDSNQAIVAYPHYHLKDNDYVTDDPPKGARFVGMVHLDGDPI